MKRLIALILSITAVFALAFVSYVPVYAFEPAPVYQEKLVSQETERCPDGSFITITITEQSSSSVRSTAFSKTGSKSYAAHDKNGHELWRFTVHGTFSVTPGVNAVCTNASYSTSVSNDSWRCESASARKSGNQAIGEAAFVKKFLGITTDRKNCYVVLSCDKNGNLS